jgi:hypothetical protein
MAFTRFHDDPCRIMKRLEEVTAQSLYYLNQPGNGDTPFYITDPHIRLQQWGANRHKNMVDLESSLLGRGTKLSRCAEAVALVNAPIQYPVDADVITDETRATQPAWQLRDTESTRTTPLYQQYLTDIPFTPVNTRAFAKQEYRSETR